MAIENDFSGSKVTVMGLNGGGLASTLHFVRRGAEVTVTDLRTEEVLRPTLESRAGNPLVALERRVETSCTPGSRQ